MRASVLFEQGTPLRVEELDLEPPREGEVLVRMVASGVCHSCLHAADGSWAGVPVPIVLGDEGAGVVEGPRLTPVPGLLPVEYRDIMDPSPLGVGAPGGSGQSLAVLGHHAGNGLDDFAVLLSRDLHGRDIEPLQRDAAVIR